MDGHTEGRHADRKNGRQRRVLTQLTKQGKSNPTNHGQKLWEPTLPHHPTDLIDKINLRTRYPHRGLVPPASSHPFTPSDQQQAWAIPVRSTRIGLLPNRICLGWMTIGGHHLFNLPLCLPPMSNKWSSWACGGLPAPCFVLALWVWLLHRPSHMGHDDAKTPDVG